jgi:hypothetical protein
MHYKNGREAKAGDKVISINNGNVVTGIIHSLQANGGTCNARVAVTTQSDPYVTMSECMHVDDVVKATDVVVVWEKTSQARSQVLSQGYQAI